MLETLTTMFSYQLIYQRGSICLFQKKETKISREGPIFPEWVVVVLLLISMVTYTTSDFQGVWKGFVPSSKFIHVIMGLI